jgi:LCP family protein required for cell wall assembly
MAAERELVPVVGPTHARRRSPSRLFTWAASAIAAIAGFGLVYSNTVLGQVDEALDGRDNTDLVSDLPEPTETGSPDPEDAASGEAINILLMGSDARDGENANIGGYVGGMRNDTTIVMHISADRSRIDLVSIPRDAQVQIPECKLFNGKTLPPETGDFNIAFSKGGVNGDPAEAAACVINTVQKMSGLTIDHWAVVDFAGFEDMVDAIGGVPMCIPEKIVSEKARLTLEPGPQVLTGKQALALARMRTAEVGSVSGSDLQRIGRQHDIMKQVSKVVLSKNLLTDAGELTQFLKAVSTALTMDTEFADTKYLLGLGFSLRNIDQDNIKFHTIPWEYTEDFLNVTILDSADIMWAQMRKDKPLTTVGDESAGEAWDEAIDESPEPAPSSTDVTEALLNECAA